MLLLHGLGATKSSFFDTAAALSRRYRVHAIDLPGFGGSSKPPLAPYGAPFAARAVIGTMDALEIDRAHLVGNSMGGRVAIEVGLERPDRVGGIALLSPAVAFVRRDWHWAVRFARPELGMLPHSLGRGRIERSSGRCSPTATWSTRAWPTSWSTSSSASTARRRPAGVPRLGAQRSTSRTRSAAAASIRGSSTLEPPALFVWSWHDRLIPRGVPPSRRALAAERRAGRARGLRPRPAGRGARSAPTGCSSASSPVSTRSAGRSAAALDDGTACDAARRTSATDPTSRRPRRGGLLGAVKARRRPRARPPTSTSATPTTSARRSRGCGCSRSLYFRGEVRGLGNVPEEGPVLLVGNHSGGNLTPDTTVFTLAFSPTSASSAPSTSSPTTSCCRSRASSFLRKYGTVAASHGERAKALEAGAAVLVYPGGDYEVHRPIVGAPPGGLRRPQGLHPARARAGRADRAGRRGRRAGDGAVPLARRARWPARSAWTGCSG